MVVTDTPALGRTSLVDEAEQAVRRWLAPGRFRRGDRLPPEHELASMLGISRGTLRSALRRLDDTGEIVRRQGSGTFVGRAASRLALGERLLRVEGYSAHGRASNISVVALRIEPRCAGREAARALRVSARDRTTVISRTLAAGDVPAAVTCDVFHPEVELPADVMRERLRAGQSMLEALTSCGIAISYSRTAISPVLLSPLDALGRRLKLRAPTACLELKEVVLSPAGDPILCSRDVFAPGEWAVEVLQSVDTPDPGPIAGHLGRDGNGHRNGAGPPDATG